MSGSAVAGDGAGHAVLWDGGGVIDLTPDVPCCGYFGPTAVGEMLGQGGRVVIRHFNGYIVDPPDGFGPPDLNTWVWDGGVLTDLTPGERSMAVPVDVDHRGRVLFNDVPVQRPAGGAVLWDNGSYARSPDVGGHRFVARAMNERGLVVGAADPSSSGGGEAHVWQPGERPEGLGTLGGEESVAEGVNHRGDIVGTSETASGETHAFLWRDGRMIDLGTLGGTYSRASAVNDWGQVIGTSRTADGESHAFLWQNGRMVDLSDLVGGVPTAVRDINDRGRVVGSSKAPGEPVRAHVWTVPVLWGHQPDVG